jgi:NAD(P)-dependent dehydrogenase (short-subunit alcohol dehydrogenase family)
MGTLDGKVALVTGAASGIGLATARLLAARGATVTLADVQDEAGVAAAAALGGTYVHLDVSDARAWEALLGGLDRLDLLHLNAGIYDRDAPDITEVSEARFHQYLGVNVGGVYFGLRRAIPLLAASRGAVVATASSSGFAPLPSNPIYSMTKHAVVGLVRSISPTLEERGIRINTVCPAGVATPLVFDDPGDAAASPFPMLAPEAVAETVVDLLESDRTGEVVFHRLGAPPRTLALHGLDAHLPE